MSSRLTARAEPQSSRLHALDWLRTITIGYVVLFHVAQVTMNGPLPGSRPSGAPIDRAIATATGLWRMPLMFLIAGATMRFVLRRRTTGSYLRDRVRRLVVPTLVGISLVMPAARVFEAPTPHDLPALAAQIWGDLFTPGIPFWSHLWFAEYLVLITALALGTRIAMAAARRAGPGVVGAVAHRAGRLTARLASVPAVTRRPLLAVHALGLGLVVVQLMPVRLVEPLNYVPGIELRLLMSSTLAFAIGVVLAGPSHRLTAVMQTRRRTAVWAVLFATAVGVMMALAGRGLAVFPPVTITGRSMILDEWVVRGLRAGGAWFGMLAVLGYGLRYTRAPVPAMTYLRDASFAVYMLHPVVLAWAVRAFAGWDAPAIAVYAALVVVTALGTLALYDGLLRRTRVGRFLFGLAPRVGDARLPLPARWRPPVAPAASHAGPTMARARA